MRAKKQRVDQLLVERGLVESRAQAQALILAGQVRSRDRVLLKAGELVGEELPLELAATPRFVSRGGDKLAHALAAFPVSVEARVCADLGASTGGFTDCLLQAGAARVYAIDVGAGQLHQRVASDPRVVVMDRTNARHLEALPEPVQLVTVDVSFISLEHILPVAARLLPHGGDLLALVKPQFEAGRGQVGKGGVVRDPETHRLVLARVIGLAAQHGFGARGLTASPLLGPAGNREFLLWGTRGHAGEDGARMIETALRAHEAAR